MCPPLVMDRVVGLLKDPVGAKPATKVLLALCLVEGNRCAAVGARAVGEVVELLAGAGLEGGAVERALAVLELLCTVAEGAEEVRGHALAVPVMVEVMGRMSGRAKEYAISVLCVILGGGENTVEPPPEVVVRAVVMALQGDCSARGRRKGAQLLKVLKENGPLDFTEDGRQGTSSIKFDDD
ncbi:hypothetical protein GIB67_010120 [Kingdonia uniflora]|uniref:U-box domain-containing protein n=1 Tax=Kingdonia uniflora TaxID=39325 RepID=A0A7J7NAV2_9MAGN|nr:hypothetical protein GIB67_010120 [Kingdonia uniflora]